MKLDLSEIAGSVGMRAVQKLKEQRLPKESGMELSGPIDGKIEIANTGSLLIITGSISAEVSMECGRCLAQFKLPVHVEIEEEFRLEKIGDSVHILPLDEEDESTEIINGSILDVQEFIRQNLVLAIPIKPICQPDCKGLCPTCGANLNMRKCKCVPAVSDSPFRALAELLDDGEESP